MVGLKPSPHLTTQSIVWSEEFIWGDYFDCDKPFPWSNIRLKLSGYFRHFSSLPWVSNITMEGNLAVDFWAYIDYMRSIASSEEEEWVFGWSISTYCTYLVI